VRREQAQEIALRLVSDHLEQIVEVLSFDLELDHFSLYDLLDRDTGRHTSAPALQGCHALHGVTEALSELRVGDLEAAHRPAPLLGVLQGFKPVLGLELGKVSPRSVELGIEFLAFRIWNTAFGIGGLGPIIHQGVEGILLAHVLEEVLLTPSLEHPVGHLDGWQVSPRGENGGLTSAGPEAGDLAQRQLALEQQHILVGENVFDLSPVEARFVEGKTALAYLARAPFAVGDDVDAVLDELLEELWAPAATVKNDGQPSAVFDHGLDLLEHLRQHFDEPFVGFGGDNEKGIPFGVVDPGVAPGAARQVC
jgi:hypothetical protein